MNMLKKGPELKRPDLKVPDFVLDIYYDLRERHLLPLVAILLVALIALPVVLSSGSDSDEPETAIVTPSATVPASKLVVAKAAPGLRDYRRRLAGRPKDPFKQHYTGSKGGGSEGVGAAPTGGEESSATVESSESSGISLETIETPEATSPSESGGEPSESNGEPTESGHLQYYSFAIDVRITPGSSEKKEPQATTRNNLPDMTMLPSRAVPALTFVGVTKDEKNAVMLVSDQVTGLFGDAKCIEGTERCQLIALEPGIPETVVYGANSRTYRIELMKLRLLKTDKPNVAPLGPSKHRGKGTDKGSGAG
jgi:hypothetical protein